MTRRPRVLAFVLIVYSLLLLLAVLSPGNDDQTGMVYWLSRRLTAVGVPDSVTVFSRLEVIMNAVIVAPVGFLGSLVVRRSSWRDWTAYAFVAASSVELIQGTFLPARHPSFSDVVANTAGAFLGAAAAGLLLIALTSRGSVPRT